MHEALHYQKLDSLAECHLCPFGCRIAEGQVGRCRVRKHEAGVLWSLNYGQVTSLAVDPIEKKPLYHFHPGASILSMGTFGCNLTCDFCQNWTIAQGCPPTRGVTPHAAAALARDRRAAGNIGIAYTYNEPFIWYEYVLDTARLVRAQGMLNVLVTNGIVEPEPLEELLPSIDAMNVDIKSIREGFYQRLCGGDGTAARRTVERAFGRCHVEITNLIIPGENDSDDDLSALFAWAASVSRRLPLHLSAYHPANRMANPPTPPATLQRAYALAREQLDFVYVGNARVVGTSDTLCPACGARAVERIGFGAVSHAPDGRCPACGEGLSIVT